ncbi:MAG: hypothetical protein HY674_16100, partial [Chloroflexi bacterium]|nr:hypothetical protein [Chloroflexota bacterium]
EAVSSGTLTKNGTAVTPGSTLLSSGETWVWTPPLRAYGTLAAFTAKGWDGSLASGSAVQVNVVTEMAPDTDGDGLADGWEQQHFGGLSQVEGGDLDGDGLTNLQEYQVCCSYGMPV